MAEAGTGTDTPSDEPPSGESGSGTADSESSPDSGNSTKSGNSADSGNSTASEHSTRKLKNKDEIKQALYDQYFFRRLWWTCVGIVLIGLGSAVLRVGQVGVDPYTAANIGISNTIGISLGSYQLISNFVLFIPMILWGRQYIGVGTIINMVMVGYLVQWFFQLLDPISWDHPTGAEKTLLFCCGILIFDYGCSLYMTSHLGNSPYDAVAPIIVDHTGAKYRVVRVIQDVFFVVLAVVFHGTIGVGTVVTAFFNGPLIDFFTEKVNKPLMKKDLDAASTKRSKTQMARSHF